MTGLALPCPAVELVPHRSPMCLIDTLDAYTEEEGEAMCVLRPGHPFADGGEVLDEIVLVEILAQAAAAHEGFNRKAGGGAVGGGFLAGVRSFRFSGTPRIGDAIRSVATRDLMLGSLQKIRGRVECQRGVLAEGELMFYLSDDPVPDDLRPPSADAGSASTGPAARLSAIPAALAASRTAFDPDDRCARYRFDAVFPAFSGHFPGHPILPAVISVLAAKQTVAAVTGWNLELEGIKNAKFVRPLFPGAEVVVRCEAPDPGDTSVWRAVVEAGEDVVSKMSLVVRARGGGPAACG